MLVDLDVSQDVYFIDCALLEFLVLAELCDWDYFDCELFFIVVVYRAVDLAIHS